MISREELKKLLAEEIVRSSEKARKLTEEKKGTAAGTSWSSIEHILVERDMDINDSYADRCVQALTLLEEKEGAILVIVRRWGEEEKEEYVVLNAPWASLSVGGHLLVSRASPLGQAVWGKGKGLTHMTTPGGPVTLEILETA